MLLHRLLKALLKTSSLKEVTVVEVSLRLIKAGSTLEDITYQSVVFGRCIMLTPLDKKLKDKMWL